MKSSPEYRLIEKFRDHHIKQLQELYQNEWWTQGRTVPEARRMLENTHFIFGVYDSDTDRLLGFARVLSDCVYKTIIFDMIVARDVLGKNIGRMLMNTILKHHRLKNVRHFELYCLPEMILFYQKWGFTDEVSGVRLLRKLSTKN